MTIIKVNFKNEIKNYKLWMILIILLTIYIGAFNIIRIVFLSNDYSEEQILKKYLLSYSLIFYILIFLPVIMLNHIKFNKVYFANLVANSYYKNLTFFITIIVDSIIIFIKLVVYILIFMVLFLTIHLWLKVEIIDLIKQITMLTLFIILLAPISYLFLYLFIEYKKIIFTLLLILFLSLNFGLTIISMILLSVKDEKITELKYQNSFGEEENKIITMSDVINYSYIANSKIEIPYFSNNEEIEVILEDYNQYLELFCNNEIDSIIVDNNIKAVCSINETQIKEVINSNSEINYIWINSLNNQEGVLKYQFIIDAIIEEDWRNKLQIIKDTLNENYAVRYEEYLDYSFLLKIYFDDNGINIFAPSEEEYQLLEDFLKMIFYYYLINYSNNLSEIDPITGIYFYKVFENFLNTDIFEEYIFWKIYDDFAWNKSDLNNDWEIFNSSNFHLYDFNNLVLTNFYFWNQFNLQLDNNQVLKLKQNIEKLKLIDRINVLKKFEYIYDYFNPNEYERNLLEILAINDWNFKKVNSLKFGQDIYDNFKIEGFDLYNDLIYIIIFIILVIVVTITLLYFNLNHALDDHQLENYDYKDIKKSRRKYQKWVGKRKYYR